MCNLLIKEKLNLHQKKDLLASCYVLAGCVGSEFICLYFDVFNSISI